METIGEKIKYYRQKRGLTQEELAKVVGYSRGYIATVETGKNSPSDEFLSKFTNSLNISKDLIYSETTLDQQEEEKKKNLVCSLIEKTRNGEIEWKNFYETVSDLTLTNYDTEEIGKVIEYINENLITEQTPVDTKKTHYACKGRYYYVLEDNLYIVRSDYEETQGYMQMGYKLESDYVDELKACVNQTLKNWNTLDFFEDAINNLLEPDNKKSVE